MKTIHVIGAGVMGAGVAQNLAQRDFKVMLLDISDDIWETTRETILKNLRFQRFFNKNEEQESPEAILERIHFSTDYHVLTKAEFVIENVPEKWEIKKDIYPRMDKLCPAPCIFAVNTSCYSITRVGGLTKRASHIIGIHFMNPVPLKSMVEVIKGYHTSEETIERTKELLSAMGKTCIVVNDYPGFVSNRILMLTINEAAFVVMDQVASAQDVDQLFKGCFEHKMGPLETADLIGLDTILYSIEALYESYNDSKYRPCPLLKKMVDAGRLGMKSGSGFYAYETDAINQI